MYKTMKLIILQRNVDKHAEAMVNKHSERDSL